MAKALDEPFGQMTVDEFLAWLDQGPDGMRYELVAGRPVAMAPERAGHARRKAQLWLALRDGIEAAGLPCEALPDGMTVKIDEHTAYEPDAVVHCEQALADDAVIVPTPIIVVEVLSPTTRARDAGAKLADYFRLSSVRHYLLVQTERRTVTHHRRGDDGDIRTRIVTAGSLQLDPPGITLELERIYG
jgi:Uma2 family endonuclease